MKIRCFKQTGYWLCALLICCTVGDLRAQMKIGANPTTIAKSSILELESNSQGLLLPRLQDTAAISALNPPDGTLIYLEGGPQTGRGLYIRKNSTWQQLTANTSMIAIDFRMNPDSTFTITYNNGATFTSPRLSGVKGEPGRGIKDVTINADSTLTMLYTDSSQFTTRSRIIARDGKGISWRGNLSQPPVDAELNWAYYDSVQKKSFIYDGESWQLLSKDGAGLSSLNFNGKRPITASVFSGQNPGTDDLAKWLEYLFYPSQGPTAGLSITYAGNTSGSVTLEQMANGAPLPATLNWQAGRQSGTADLGTITVAGNSISFTQPAAGAGVSGTVSVLINRNSNASFSNTVVTSDNKSASASVGFNFSWKRYYGFLGTSLPNETMFTPGNAEILSLQQEFGASRGFAKTISNTTAKRLVIAYPAAWDGNDTVILVSGLNQTDAFDRQIVSFTNASGATTNYVVYVQKNNTSAGISFTVQ